MTTTQVVGFVDRRNPSIDRPAGQFERRQFAESRDALSEDVRELAEAIDAYKISHRRRFVTLAEVLDVMKNLGYHK